MLDMNMEREKRDEIERLRIQKEIQELKEKPR